MSIMVMILLLGAILAGCQPMAQVPTVPEPPLVAAQAVCEPVPPQIIEVPVPVPMPGQFQPEPDLTQEAAGPKKGERVGRPTKGAPINAVTEYRYVEGALYQAYVALEKATTVFLAPGETFEEAIIGDKAAWSAGKLALGEGDSQRAGVWVSCHELGKRSTLTIPGSKHLYLLELYCTENTFHASISWAYAKPSGVGVIKGVPPVPMQTATVAPARETPSATRYTWGSNREVAWSPLYVYDTGTNGGQTVIVFPAALSTTDAPVLYVRSPEGTQGLVNYRVRQGYWLGDRIVPANTVAEKLGAVGAPLTYYLVDRIAAKMELRVGEKSPTVVTIRQQEERS